MSDKFIALIILLVTLCIYIYGIKSIGSNKNIKLKIIIWSIFLIINCIFLFIVAVIPAFKIYKYNLRDGYCKEEYKTSIKGFLNKGMIATNFKCSMVIWCEEPIDGKTTVKCSMQKSDNPDDTCFIDCPIGD